ncbi:MAG: TolC family protein [Planctomycetes bacterium]|nr:TolC family protein [Planctomycetota bacterium]
MSCLLLFLLALSPPASGLQEVPAEGGLTLEEIRDLVRRAAPSVLLARARVEEARGRLTTASYLLPENPLLELDGGPRFRDGDRSGDIDATLSIPLLTGGKRSSRIDSAKAEVEAETARIDEAVRIALGQASRAFHEVLFGEERIRFAEERERIGRELLRTAERREAAGQAPAFEVQIAGVEAGRSRGEVAAARASLAFALLELRTILGWPSDRPLSVRGDLRDRGRFELDRLLERAADRPDLRALASEAKRARSDVELASARRWPDLSFRIGYEREEGADVLKAGLGVPLPLVDRGQGALEEAEARAGRARTEYEYARSGAEGRLRLLWERFERLEEAVGILEREALPRLEEAESSARAGYEGGYLPLPQWLVVRREILETRALYLQRLLETAQAGVDLEFEAGVER